VVPLCSYERKYFERKKSPPQIALKDKTFKRKKLKGRYEEVDALQNYLAQEKKKKFTTHYQSSDKAQHTERCLRKGV
jgi:hypothetical protein